MLPLATTNSGSVPDFRCPRFSLRRAKLEQMGRNVFGLRQPSAEAEAVIAVIAVIEAMYRGAGDAAACARGGGERGGCGRAGAGVGNGAGAGAVQGGDAVG